MYFWIENDTPPPLWSFSENSSVLVALLAPCQGQIDLVFINCFLSQNCACLNIKQEWLSLWLMTQCCRGGLDSLRSWLVSCSDRKSKRWQWIFSHILTANQLTYHQASWRSFCWNKQGISLRKLCFMWEWKWRTNVWDIKLFVKVKVLEWEKPRENLFGDPLIGEWFLIDLLKCALNKFEIIKTNVWSYIPEPAPTSQELVSTTFRSLYMSPSVPDTRKNSIFGQVAIRPFLLGGG